MAGETGLTFLATLIGIGKVATAQRLAAAEAAVLGEAMATMGTKLFIWLCAKHL